VQSGFPVNIQSYAQQNGRAGRDGIRHETNPYICCSVVSVESFNHIFLQIQQAQQKEIKAEKTREFEEVFELMIIPKQCIHQAIENRLEALRRNNDETEQDQILGPCGRMCWFCRGEDMIPIDSRKDLKSLLEVLLVDGNVESDDLPKLLLEKRQTLWKSFFAPKATKKETIEKEQVIRASCSSLVLKLIAAKILRPSSNLKNESRPSVILRWGRRENNGGIELAYRSAIGWDSIPSCITS
jgi:superfamily II DNA helicase RecQ